MTNRGAEKARQGRARSPVCRHFWSAAPAYFEKPPVAWGKRPTIGIVKPPLFALQHPTPAYTAVQSGISISAAAALCLSLPSQRCNSSALQSRSHLRVRSGSVLTAHRIVIHFQPHSLRESLYVVLPLPVLPRQHSPCPPFPPRFAHDSYLQNISPSAPLPHPRNFSVLPTNSGIFLSLSMLQSSREG